MKLSTTRLLAILAAFSMLGLQACNAYVYDPGGWHSSPGWGWGHGWGHGGWDHGGGGWDHGGHEGHGGGWDHGGHEGHGGGGHGGGGHGGGGHGGGHHLEIMGTQLATDAAPQDLLVAKYGISSSSSETIVKLAQSNERRQAKALASMGLSSDDIGAFAKLEMPSADGIDKMATALNEDPAKIQALITDFITDIKVEKEAK